jgi:hypothetical protein
MSPPKKRATNSSRAKYLKVSRAPRRLAYITCGVCTHEAILFVFFFFFLFAIDFVYKQRAISTSLITGPGLFFTCPRNKEAAAVYEFKDLLERVGGDVLYALGHVAVIRGTEFWNVSMGLLLLIHDDFSFI